MSEENNEVVEETAEVIAPVEQPTNIAYGYTYDKEQRQFFRHTIEFNVDTGEAKVISTDKAGKTRALVSFDANKSFTQQIMNINML